MIEAGRIEALDAGEILQAVFWRGRSMKREQVPDERAERDGGIPNLRIRERETQVLEHQPRLKAALEGVARRCVFDDPRPRIPSIQHEVVAAAPLEDVRQRRGIESIPYTQRKRLGSAGHEYSREHIVAALGNLPGAAMARVEDGPAPRTDPST